MFSVGEESEEKGAVKKEKSFFKALFLKKSLRKNFLI